MTPTSDSAESFQHTPVLVAEVTALLTAVPAGWVADCTVGGGGHAAALLEAAPHLSVLGLDRDADARSAAEARLVAYGARARVVAARFDDLGAVCARQGIGRLSGALFDLGVSSPQLDRAERGFSHRFDAALDMRMDRSSGRTADDVVNGTTADELAALLRAGEKSASRRASPPPSSRPGPSPRRERWPPSSATPSRRPPVAAAATPPTARSRPSVSR